MENGNNGGSTGGIGFVDLLTLVFITLKLLKVITWSWVWVLSPIWITIVIFMIIAGGFITVSKIEDWRQERRWKK